MILLLMSLAFADEPQYAVLEKGEPAPFEGRLFNGAAVAKIITEAQYKDLECDLQVEFETDKLATEKQFEIELLKASLESKNLMLTELNQINQEELDTIRASYKPARPYLWLTSGFVLGSAASIAIFHAVKE